MRIVLLTTETAHHAWFAHRLVEHWPIAGALLETAGGRPGFETAHAFERERERYEAEALAATGGVGAVRPVWEVGSCNEPAALERLAALAPDVLVVFGTGVLGVPVIGSASVACLNLHGGDPERYRGLDSHLWSLYHDDPSGLVVCLHHVDAGRDVPPVYHGRTHRHGVGVGQHHPRCPGGHLR